MNKPRLTFLLLMSGIVPCIAGESGVLTPESCNVGDRPFTAPLHEIYFKFDGGIKLLESASAIVECDGKAVTTATNIEVSNYRGKKRTQGTLILTFDEQNLPKGKSYNVYVAPGSISQENNAEIKNQTITQGFYVPENLGEARIDLKDGAVISTVSPSVYHSFPTFYWGIETEPTGNPYFILYREGVAVRELPAYICWDWDLGQARADVTETMNFEQGVRYTLTLPAGSAHAMRRDDIVNEEVSFSFIGGYTEPIQTLTYSSCSLFTDHPNVLNEVTFTYQRPIHLAEDAVIQLWYADESELIMEAKAYINTDINCFAVSADFGRYEMTSERGYTLVIPKGTVIADYGDPVMNHRCSIPLTDVNGIHTVAETNDSAAIYDMNGHKVTSPAIGKIYVRKGKTFIYK
ncbi:MAG: hypothetical protein K2J58_05745 [Muribaculaceae bacterium]|nr:hypothetical protein [Muribaculaceae bacterium]